MKPYARLHHDRKNRIWARLTDLRTRKFKLMFNLPDSCTIIHHENELVGFDTITTTRGRNTLTQTRREQADHIDIDRYQIKKLSN